MYKHLVLWKLKEPANGMISAFPHEAAFKRYCVYPEHDAVVACIQSVTVAEEIVDYRV